MFKYILWIKIFFTLTKISSGVPNITGNNSSLCGNVTCFNNAKCRGNGLKCMCQRGNTGAACSEDFDECNIGDPCFHRGYCHNTFGSYRCECLKGWTGGTNHCGIKDNSAIHLCTPGWMGDNCQVQCLNDSMCQNQGECKKFRRGKKCFCASGWTGINCSTDVDECISKPCPNNYTSCTNNPGSYRCQCLSGWKGVNCYDDIDECFENPCQHSSNCTNAPGYYNCTCSHGWRGTNCSEATINHILNVRRTYTIVAIVICSLLLGCSVVVFIGIIKFKCFNMPGNTTIIENESKTQIKRRVHNQRYKHDQRRERQCKQHGYLLNHQQTLQLHVHVHQAQQSQYTSKPKEGHDKESHSKQKSWLNNFQLHQLNLNHHNHQAKHVDSQLESYDQYVSKAGKTITNDQEELFYENNQEVQEHASQEEEEQQQHQQEEEYRSKYWLRKINRYFIRITNPLWRY